METMEFRQSLFWDVNPQNIDPQKNAQYVIERILDFGADKEVKWMWDYYEKPLLRKVVERSRCLRPETKNFWKLFLKDAKIIDKDRFSYHHIGIPINKPIKGEKYLKKYKLYHTDYNINEFGIEWMRYDDDCALPEIIKAKPHLAFEVENVSEAIKGRKVIIKPNSPSKGVKVAFIEESGVPIELIQFKT